jgi:hypothetical protein
VTVRQMNVQGLSALSPSLPNKSPVAGLPSPVFFLLCQPMIFSL